MTVPLDFLQAARRSQAPTGPFALTGKRNKDLRGFGDWAAGGYAAGQPAKDYLTKMLLGNVTDPTRTAGQFQDYFTNAAQAAAAPAMRDFASQDAATRANVASRFGGNVSSEELRQGAVGQDLFSRNLTEALARVGPQAVGAGQAQNQYTLAARSLLGGEQLDLQQLILQSILGEKQGSNWFSKLLGATVGKAADWLIPDESPFA